MKFDLVSRRDLPPLRWLDILHAMAKDMRHELLAEVAQLWAEKLKRFPDEVVCKALINGHWTQFPSTGEVLSLIDSMQERRRQDVADQEWPNYQREQKRAANEGLLASEEDYAEMRSALEKLRSAKAIPRIEPTVSSYTPLPREELVRRKLEQLQAVRQKYGAQRLRSRKEAHGKNGRRTKAV